MERLALLKKILFGLLILAAVISLLLVGQIKVATYLFDSKLESALSRAERALPGLKLSYTPGNNSFTVRQGRLFYEIPLKKGNSLLGAESVSGAVDLKIGFGPLRVTGAIDSVAGAGNLEDILRRFNVDPISFTGAFRARAVTPRLDATLKTDSFLIPTSTGICKLGQNSFNFYATSQEDVDVEFSSAGVVCEGALRYNNKPNYRLDLLGVDVKFLPRIINNKPHFDSLIINLKQLDFKFSTLYAIDDEGMAKLTFDNSGNYGFAFPYIQYDEVQPFYRLDNFKLSGSLERISIPRLFDAAQSVLKNASSQFETNKVLKEILHGFSDTITLAIDQFGFDHEGKSLNVNGTTHVAFDESSNRPRVGSIDADINIKVDKTMLEEAAGDNYLKALQSAVAAGQITDDGQNYSTVFSLQGKQMALNHIPVQSLVSQDDLLYEEEQKALEAQRAQERAAEAALRAEIEAAQRAQENLPSMVDSNIGNNAPEEADPSASD